MYGLWQEGEGTGHIAAGEQNAVTDGLVTAAVVSEGELLGPAPRRGALCPYSV